MIDRRPIDEVDPDLAQLIEREVSRQRSNIDLIASENLASIATNLDRGSVDELLVRVLGEAQTSGGVLISVPADRTDALIAHLKERGTWCADVIGDVAPKRDRSIVLK